MLDYVSPVLDHEIEETISDTILKYLCAEDVRIVFGMHGGYTVGIGDKLNDYSDITFVRCQHEEGAAFMADGYAKATGKFGALIVTAGPGVTNALTGILSSLADQIPVLMISGAVPRKKAYMGAIQDTESFGVDVSTVMKACSRFHANVYTDGTFVQLFRSGTRHLHRGKKGPVIINIASDLFLRKIIHNCTFQGHGDNMYFEADAVKHALTVLKKSKNVVIFAGNGVKLSNSQRELEKLVELLKLPVITSPKGKSAFNNESPYYLGNFGAGSHPVVEKYLEKEPIDTVIAFGTSFNEYSSNAWSLYLKNVKTLIQVDIDPQVIGRSFVNTLGINGDCGSTLRYMRRKVLEEPDAYHKLDSRSRIDYYKSTYPEFEDVEQYNSNAIPIKVPRLFKDIFDSFYPYDVNVFNDNGSCIWWANHYLKLKNKWQFYGSLGFCSMGYAIPAAIGGASGRPDKATIAICGDGAAIMNGNELKTAAEYNIALFVFVLNDGRLNVVYHSTNLICKRPNVGTEYKEPIDFVKFAESMGVEAYRIDEPGQINAEFIKGLYSKQKPILFDCRISIDELGPYGGRISQVVK